MKILYLVLIPAVCASAMLAGCQLPPVRPDLYGDPASPAGAVRTIVILPETKWVNVQGGDTVAFVVGGRTFAWSFDGAVRSFDLRAVAPPGLLDHSVIAYVAPDPKYLRR